MRVCPGAIGAMGATQRVYSLPMRAAVSISGRARIDRRATPAVGEVGGAAGACGDREARERPRRGLRAGGSFSTRRATGRLVSPPAASSPGGRNGALGASHQRRGRRRGSGRREAVDRAEAVGRARERPERPERPEARAGRRLPIGRAPWTRRARHSRSAGQKKTKRHAYAAARCEAPPGGQMESGPRGRGAGRRRHALHRLVEPRRRAFTRSPSQPGRRRARSSSCAWGLNCGEFWGGLRRAAEATASC